MQSYPPCVLEMVGFLDLFGIVTPNNLTDSYVAAMMATPFH
jgi:hypothetical protein